MISGFDSPVLSREVRSLYILSLEGFFFLPLAYVLISNI
jgi:hypothetical protein